MAPCNVRGKPLGPPAEGCARILEDHETQLAEQLIAANYGAGRAMYERTSEQLGMQMTYVEVSPARIAEQDNRDGAIASAHLEHHYSQAEIARALGCHY